MIKGEVEFLTPEETDLSMLKAALELNGPSTLTRKIGSVNGVVLKLTVANTEEGRGSVK